MERVCVSLTVRSPAGLVLATSYRFIAAHCKPPRTSISSFALDTGPERIVALHSSFFRSSYRRCAVSGVAGDEPVTRLEYCRGDPSPCILTILYTVVGGIEAVIWTDVVQAVVLLGGGLVCAGLLLIRMPGGAGEALSTAWDQDKFSLGSWDFNLAIEGSGSCSSLASWTTSATLASIRISSSDFWQRSPIAKLANLCGSEVCCTFPYRLCFC